ncbi:MAG: vitamin B12/bleomycin/antimicrobial peptide transport system ATP-binding/permease protein [Mycobacterium sp.]|nr:vitamin B12/bleomycin/antimicrobial peptide transport system ATP-binding/permease protein [Mycobacterium sp.]
MAATNRNRRWSNAARVTPGHGDVHPSLDWGDEIVGSLLWVAKAWVISAACMVLALTLIAWFTAWGGQFWRVTGGYFKDR